MIRAKSFVFLNFPKTGSTWLRTVIKNSAVNWTKSRFGLMPFALSSWLYAILSPNCLLYEEILTPHWLHDGKNQHSTRSRMEEILPVSEKKVIVGIWRDVESRFLSLYNYRWWAKHPEKTFVDVDGVKAFKTFPDLSLEEFHELMTEFDEGRGLIFHPELPSLGYQSKALIHFYASIDFKSQMSSIQDGTTFLEEFIKDIGEICFFNQKTLRDDFVSFARVQRLPKNMVLTALDLPKKNVSSTSETKENPIGNSLREKILESEWLYVETGRKLGLEK